MWLGLTKRGSGTARRQSAVRGKAAALVWWLSIIETIFLGRSDARYQEEPSPLMGEGWVGVVSPQYNRRNEECSIPGSYLSTLIVA